MPSSNTHNLSAGYIWRYIGYFKGNEVEQARATSTHHTRQDAIDDALKCDFDFPSCYSVIVIVA